jgi:pyrroline-5-carboxylate reductase
MTAMPKDWPGRIVLVGAGKMGGAMAAGWLDAGLDPKALAIVEPNPSGEIAALAARGAAINPGAPTAPEVLVLAIKPQSLDSVAPQIAPLASPRTLVLSILAGKTIENLIGRFPGVRAVVRAMPNTPAAIGRGVTAAFASPGSSASQRSWCDSLLGAIGDFFWLEDEGSIDVVTAISGGGPAYVFALTEALAAAAAKLGLRQELADRLARGTVEGAGELLRRERDTSPAVLRRNVTSPGGTTAAALAILQGAGALDDLMFQAAAAARARAVEMAG